MTCSALARRAPLFVLAALLTSLAAPARAYVHQRIPTGRTCAQCRAAEFCRGDICLSEASHWEPSNASTGVSWMLQPSGSNLADATVTALATEAFDRWDAETVSCSTLRFTKVAWQGTAEVNGELLNKVFWVSGSSWTYGDTVLGVTITKTAQGDSVIRDADVAFNAGRSWRTGVCNQSRTDGYCTDSDERIDFLSVAVHEFGHFTGLGHSEELTAMMFAAYDGPRQHLTEDDRLGLCHSYPARGGAAAPQGTSCVDDTDCAAGLRCLVRSGSVTSVCTTACEGVVGCRSGFLCAAVEGGEAPVATSTATASSTDASTETATDASTGTEVDTSSATGDGVDPLPATACFPPPTGTLRAAGLPCTRSSQCADSAGVDDHACVSFNEGSYCLRKCTSNSDCASGTTCSNNWCRFVVDEGSACLRNLNLCASGLVCLESNPDLGPQCFRKCDPASKEPVCGAGRMCAEAADGSGACVPAANPGEACHSLPCVTGATCVGEEQGQPPVCRSFCTAQAQCPSGQICRPLSSGQSVCTTTGYGAQVMPECAACNDAARCQPGLTCVGSGDTATCRRACEDASACGGESCVGEDGAAYCRCGDDPAVGECREDADCPAGEGCVLDADAIGSCVADTPDDGGAATDTTDDGSVDTSTDGGGGDVAPRGCGCTTGGPEWLAGAALLLGLRRRRTR